MGFELQLAGARNVKAARALLADHGNDIEKLKAAGPWLFSVRRPRAIRVGAAMKRWLEIAGLGNEGKEVGLANTISSVKNYTAIMDEVYKRASCLTRLNSPRHMARAGRNAKEIMISKTEVTGLG